MPEFPGGQQARVAGDDHAVRADENRIRPPELGDAGGDLRDLLVRMRPRVPGVGNEAVDLTAFHDEIAQDTLGHMELSWLVAVSCAICIGIIGISVTPSWQGGRREPMPRPAGEMPESGPR